MKTSVLFSFVLMSFVLSAKPAAANITSAMLTTQTPTFQGACPVAIAFKGTITGSPGTIFTYAFNRLINNQQQKPLTYVGPIPMPQSGTYSVNDSIQISSSTIPETADQIYIISGSQQVYSNTSDAVKNPSGTRTDFSVSCWKLNPNVVNQANPTKPKLSGGIITQAYVAPPNGLKSTSSSQECGSHGGGFNCIGAFGNQPPMLVLVWCWGSNNPCAATSTDQHISKFNIYEVDSGKHAYVTSTNADPQYGNLATVGFVNQPGGGFTNQCYAVTAVYGNTESVTSNAVCLGNGSVGPFTTVLHPVQTAVHSQSSQYGTGLPFRAACGALCVGWQHDQSSVISPSFIPIWWYADNYRSYYLFDVSSIAGTYVTSATLKIPIDSGDSGCFSGIAEANQDWTNNLNWIGGDFLVPSGDLNSGLDVTSMVRDWVNGQPNRGFVLRGSNENLVAESSSCRTAIDPNAELDIVHS
ncbi:MAG: DNRLRE domain-containing protein [Candidatus Eremiobacteraeota bacterium]|nr:DNRLRE domain-containing protein [Candidatus Eremiobacteraeota bacterium]MBV8223109.1 DNRLRE domain-containing protein [Candidatus Eremiobacteraeota bacterium]